MTTSPAPQRSESGVQDGRTLTEASLLHAAIELWRFRYAVAAAAVLGALLAWGMGARAPLYEKRLTFIVPPSDDSDQRWTRIRSLLDSGVIGADLGPESLISGFQTAVVQELKDANQLIAVVRLSDPEGLVTVAERVGAAVLERDRAASTAARMAELSRAKKLDDELLILQAQAEAVKRSLLVESRTVMLRRGLAPNPVATEMPRRDGATIADEQFNPTYAVQRSLLLDLELKIVGMAKTRELQLESQGQAPAMLGLLSTDGRVLRIPSATARNVALGFLAGASLGFLAAVISLVARRARAMLAAMDKS